jgi:glycosyltransferase involved in cell wall biosynthesis
MKILLIHNFYQYWGGEDGYVTSLKKLLEEKGNKVYLYSKDSKNIKTFWDKIKATIVLFYNPWIEKELVKIIREFKPDIAHFHNVYPLIGATVYRVVKKFNIPIVQHIHNYRFMCPKGLLFRNGKICELCLNKKFPFWAIFFGCYHQSRIASLFFSLTFFYHKMIKTFDSIDKFIFPSEFTRDYYLKNLKIPKEKTFFLPYFVDIKPTKKKVKEKDYFLFVGRLSEEKGIIQLLEVFKTLPRIKLVVIGNGPLKGQVEEYRRYKNIIIKGYLPREEIYSYIKKANAMIISSLWYEVLPNVYLESIFQNTPVFIPDNENFRRIEENNNLVIKYKFGNFEDLKRKIKIFKKYSFKRLLVDLEKYSKINHLREIINLIKNSKRQK